MTEQDNMIADIKALMEQTRLILGDDWHIAVFPYLYLNQYGGFRCDHIVCLTRAIPRQQFQVKGDDLRRCMDEVVAKVKEHEAMDALNETCIES